MVEFVSIDRIAAIKNGMRVALKVSASDNLLCKIISCSGCEYYISSSSNLSSLSNTVLNSFGISNKVLLDMYE